MKNQTTRQEKERLGNKLVFFSSVTISYAILLLFIQKMASSTLTANGALALISLLRWTSLCGAMACAAWSAYKEKKGFFLYCAMCIFVFFSTTVLLFMDMPKSYPINYVALAIAFIMAQIYYNLRIKGKFSGTVKKVFVIVSFVIIAAIAFYCGFNINWSVAAHLMKK